MKNMWKDPIVNDIRKAGEELAEQAGYDVHTYFDMLRNIDKKECDNMNDNKKTVIVLATGNKREFYDLIVSDILAGNLDLINEMVEKERTVLLSYDTFSGKSGEQYEGFDKLFKFNELVELINRYLLENKLGLVASKDLYNNRTVIRFSRFARFESKEGENFVSKTERITTKDDVEIVENSSKDSDKDKIAKKIEESRKLITEG